MDKYEYKAIPVGFNIWKGKLKEDYLEIINEQGSKGWRFIDFAPSIALPKGKKGIELIFERKLID